MDHVLVDCKKSHGPGGPYKPREPIMDPKDPQGLERPPYRIPLLIETQMVKFDMKLCKLTYNSCQRSSPMPIYVGFTTPIDIPDDDFKHRLGQSEIFLS